MVLGSTFESGEGLKTLRCSARKSGKVEGSGVTRTDLIWSTQSRPVGGGWHLFCCLQREEQGPRNRGDKKNSLAKLQEDVLRI